MGLPDLPTLRERFRSEWPQVVRIIIAAAVGWWICVLIEPDQLPIFAIVVPLMAMRDQPFCAAGVDTRNPVCLADVLAERFAVQLARPVRRGRRWVLWVS